MSERIPMLTPPGWDRSVFIRTLNGPTYRMLFYEDGTIRFEHQCDRGVRGIVICAPALRIGEGDSIVQDDPLTVSPSILCPDCGTHGFIQNGRWVAS